MLLIEWRLGLLLLFTQVPVIVVWLQRRYRKANYGCEKSSPTER